MRTESQKTKLALLLEHVDQWRERVGSREAVAIAIVEAHIAAGFNGRTKLQFETSGNPFTLAKNAADRIFRWLDDKTKDGNFMPANFEDSILIAMPEDLRLSYLNAWLKQFGMGAKGVYAVDDESCPRSMLPGVIKESAEAKLALATLPENPTVAEIDAADAEFSEAIEKFRKVQSSLRAKRGALRSVA